MVNPDPELAPVILPVIDPTIQLKELGTVAVRLIFVLVPLHILAVLEVVTTGNAFTVKVAAALETPSTMHLYWLPFIERVTLLRVKVLVICPTILTKPVPPMLSCHWLLVPPVTEKVAFSPTHFI